MITSARVERRGGNGYRVFAESDLGAAAVLYWYWNGGLVAVGVLPFMDFEVGPGEPGRWEVLDSDTDVPGLAFSSRVRLEWENVDGAVKYQVWQAAGEDASAQVGLVKASGYGTTSWVSAVLDDGVEYTFEVWPVGVHGNVSNMRRWVVPMVRVPSVPGTVGSYDGEVLTVDGE